MRSADGWHEGLTVTAVTDMELEAEVDGASVTIRREDVVEMKVERDALGKTVGLAIGLGYAILGVLVLGID